MRPTDELPQRRLYRNRDTKLVAGVCAGVADYFGFDIAITRIVVVLGLFFFLPTTLIGYFLLALLLPPKPYGSERDPGNRADGVQRSVRASPHATLDAIRHRFREMDSRLQRLEKYVTSKRFALDREFETLKD